MAESLVSRLSVLDGGPLRALEGLSVEPQTLLNSEAGRRTLMHAHRSSLEAGARLIQVLSLDWTEDPAAAAAGLLSATICASAARDAWWVHAPVGTAKPPVVAVVDYRWLVHKDRDIQACLCSILEEPSVSLDMVLLEGVASASAVESLLATLKECCAVPEVVIGVACRGGMTVEGEDLMEVIDALDAAPVDQLRGIAVSAGPSDCEVHVQEVSQRIRSDRVVIARPDCRGSSVDCNFDCEKLTPQWIAAGAQVVAACASGCTTLKGLSAMAVCMT